MKPEIYEKLAACGRYHNTGKVLIGLQYEPRQKIVMTRDDEIIQLIMLGHRLPCPWREYLGWAAYTAAVAGLLWLLNRVLP